MLGHGSGRQLSSLCRNRYCLASLRQTPFGHRNYATVTTSSLPRAGEVINGFRLQRSKQIPELNLTGLKLQHEKTGAQYLHVAREDNNNVFAVNFKTNPDDNTGLPHILEHVTLCGSEKYPVRDPFFKMMPRSLSNYMNAFTASDYTSYPFSTTNKQDFLNLSDVYLDSTLRPLLKRSDFLQEGWRIGPHDLGQQSLKETLELKGVVYNEMKGQMSDASYLYYVRFRDFIYPTLFNSGGDPEQMTSLTYNQLVDYSRKNYHPSNARFFSYGDLDLSAQLKLVNAGLHGFDRQPSQLEVRQPRQLESSAISKEILGPMDPMLPSDQQIKSSVSWLVCDTSNDVETFAFTVLSSLLLNGYGSPLHQGLIESGLGTSFSPNTGFDPSGPVGIFSVGLDGMKEDDVPGLKDRIREILREKLADAIKPHRIEGLLHQVELSIKHQTTSFGMGILNKILPAWFNGLDPLDALKHDEIIKAFRKNLKQPDYLQELTSKYLDNDKCAIFTMQPSSSFSEELGRREIGQREDLFTQMEAMSADPKEALDTLRKQEEDLLREQTEEKDANIDTLPSLHVSDIPVQMERRPMIESDISGSRALWREGKTNGITYIQANHELRGLPNDLRLLMPLFTDALMRLGTKSQTVKQLEDETLLKTGGISISPFAYSNPWDARKFREGLDYGSYALDKDVPAMLGLIRSLACDIDFESPQAAKAIQELLESKVTGALDAVAESGHSFAVASASAALSNSSWMQEQLSGLSQIESSARFLAQCRSGDEGYHAILQKLKAIQKFAISNSDQLTFRVVCEKGSTKANRLFLSDFKKNLPDPQQMPEPASGYNDMPQSKKQFFDLPFQVSYTGVCQRTVPYTSPSTPALLVLARLLRDNYLHPNIREKGGAYGASSDANMASLFTMSSYRDPNPRKTLETIQEAGKFARDTDWSARQLEEGKLSVFQTIDAPRSVDTDGARLFAYGITEDMQQDLRGKLLETTKADVQKAAQDFLVDPSPEHQAVCVLGEGKNWTEKGWTVKTVKMSEA